jgi:tetratricopeptide (TPR) repeat protein
MPQVDQVRHRSNKPVIAVVGAVVVVAVIVGAVLFMMNQPKEPVQKTSVVQNNAREKAFVGKKDEAIELLKQQVEQTKDKSKEERVSLYMQLGGLYDAKKEYKSALEAYKNADALIHDFGIYEAMAGAAEASGDKALALDYYKRGRAWAKESGQPYSTSALQRTEEAIVRLGGKL